MSVLTCFKVGQSWELSARPPGRTETRRDVNELLSDRQAREETSVSRNPDDYRRSVQGLAITQLKTNQLK